MKNKETHTPGPWRAVEKDGEWAVVADEIKKSFSVSRLYICREIEQGYDTGESDAKLISAAPDLLDGVKALLAVINEMRSGVQGQEPEWNDCISLAEEAITKATS
jgi:hypothetical protein